LVWHIPTPAHTKRGASQVVDSATNARLNVSTHRCGMYMYKLTSSRSHPTFGHGLRAVHVLRNPMTLYIPLVFCGCACRRARGVRDRAMGRYGIWSRKAQPSTPPRAGPGGSSCFVAAIYARMPRPRLSVVKSAAAGPSLTYDVDPPQSCLPTTLYPAQLCLSVWLHGPCPAMRSTTPASSLYVHLSSCPTVPCEREYSKPFPNP
jgi:hypothetical protein